MLFDWTWAIVGALVGLVLAFVVGRMVSNAFTDVADFADERGEGEKAQAVRQYRNATIALITAAFVILGYFLGGFVVGAMK